MSKDKVDQMIVRHIIGDIRLATVLDDGFDESEFDDITDEEIAEFDALPEYEFALGQEERLHTKAMKVARWCFYRQEMRERGLPFLDMYEYMNMEVEPTVPEEDEP